MFDPAFLCYAPGSRRYADVLEAGEAPQLLSEIRRTLDALAAAAPASIARGRTTEDQAKAVMFLWLAIANDLEAGDAWLAEYRTLPSGCDLPNWSVAERIAARGDGYTWADKVEALQREIANRRDTYSGLVDKGQLTRDQAKAQLERLEAVHDLYLRSGFTFDGTREEGREINEAVRGAWVDQDGEAPISQVAA